jgi:hypothetical protein
VARDDIGFEFMNALRLSEGVAATFTERTGYPLSRSGPTTATPCTAGRSPCRTRRRSCRCAASRLFLVTPRRARELRAPLVHIEATGVER